MNLYSLRLLLRSLFRRAEVENELDEELCFHLEEKVDEMTARGIPEMEARAVARREFGNLGVHQESCRDQRGLNYVEALLQDLRYSARALRRSPGFTLLAIASLGVGIGATSALFSIVDVALLHPIAGVHPERLLWLQEFSPDGQESAGNPLRLADWQSVPAFEGAAGFYEEGAVWTGTADPVRLDGLRYVGPLPEILEARTQLGRLPVQGEILLTAAAWKKYFENDPSAVGRALRLGAKTYRVAGVLDPGIRYPESTDFWSPLSREAQNSPRDSGFLAQVARLQSGSSMEQAQAQANALALRMGRDHATSDRGRAVHLQTLSSRVAQASRASVLLLFGAALGVLLIACVNVAGLLLARGLNRQREASIRVALGAGRERLVRLFLAESLLLAVLGSVSGMALAWLGLDVLKRALPEGTPRIEDAVIGPRVLAFGIALAMLAAGLSGLTPAWIAAVQAIAPVMRGRRTVLRPLLVVTQVALSFVLLVSSGLLIRSFIRMKGSPLGFEPQRACSFSVAYPWDTDGRVLRNTVRDVLERLSAAPGTQSAGVVDRLPLHGGTQTRAVVIAGMELAPMDREREIGWRVASPGYFAAAGTPLLTGTMFRPDQRECVISQHLASSLFAGQNPLGHQIAGRPRGAGKPLWFRITGVVADTRNDATDHAGAQEVYVPWGADYWPLLNFVVRSNQPLSNLAAIVNQQVKPLLAGQILSPLTSLETLTAETRSVARTRAWLATSLASVALLLSAIGLFGLLAHETSCRTREFGVRMALGALPVSLAADALRRGLRLAMGGVVLGLSAAVITSRMLASLLFEIGATDWLTYGLASLALLLVALLACLPPALRVFGVDPAAALRHN